MSKLTQKPKRTDWHRIFLLGKQEGRQEGELVNKIQMLQQILKKPVSSQNELFGKNISELQILANTLHTEWMRVD